MKNNRTTLFKYQKYSDVTERLMFTLFHMSFAWDAWWKHYNRKTINREYEFRTEFYK